MLKNNMKKKKGIMVGVAIGMVCGILAMPALQFASADAPDLEPYKESAEVVAQEVSSVAKVNDDMDDIDDVDDRDDIDDRDDRDDAVENKQAIKQNNNSSLIAQAKQELAKIEAQENALDRKEDQLERDYESGKISREEFLEQERAIELQEDKLDAQEDKWERVLGDDDDDDEWDDD